MNYNIQLKIQNDINLKKYLRENSLWYKYLNRNPEYINQMSTEMKEKYSLRRTDKLSNAIDSLDFINKFIKEIK